MNDNRQRNGDSNELLFPCSRPIKLILLVDSAAPAEPADNMVCRGRR